MIVKDEEEFISRCLASAKDAVDEIIVVDTGSSDRTREIAAEHGARVIETDWVDDFSAVRNIGLDEAKGDWILFLDADEVLEGGSARLIREAIKDSDLEGFMLTIVNLQGENEDSATEQTSPSPRLFRNKPAHRFHGVIHEQVTFDETKSGSVGELPVRVRHYGYLGPVKEVRDKNERNRALIDQSDWDDERKLLLSADQELEQGLLEPALEKYIKVYEALSQRDLMNIPAVAVRIIHIYRGTDRPAEALAWSAKALERWPDYTDLEYLRALTYLEQQDHASALASFTACLLLGEPPSGYESQTGVGTWLAYQGLGFVYLALRTPFVAARAFTKALEINNRDALSAGNLGQIYLSSDNDPAVVKAELDKLADREAPEILEAYKRLFG